MLSPDWTVPARQPAAFHSVSGGGGIRGRDRGGCLFGSPVPDECESGWEDGISASGADRAVDVAAGLRLRDRLVRRHKALDKSLNSADECCTRDRRLPSRSFRPWAFRGRGQSGRAPAHEYGTRKPVAGFVADRSRARGLVRDRRAVAEHADAGRDRPNLRHHEYCRTGSCHGCGSGLGS